jgi:hypothetical protein
MDDRVYIGQLRKAMSPANPGILRAGQCRFRLHLPIMPYAGLALAANLGELNAQ